MPNLNRSVVFLMVRIKLRQLVVRRIHGFLKRRLIIFERTRHGVIFHQIVIRHSVSNLGQILHCRNAERRSEIRKHVRKVGIRRSLQIFDFRFGGPLLFLGIHLVLDHKFPGRFQRIFHKNIVIRHSVFFFPSDFIVKRFTLQIEIDVRITRRLRLVNRGRKAVDKQAVRNHATVYSADN